MERFHTFFFPVIPAPRFPAWLAGSIPRCFSLGGSNSQSAGGLSRIHPLVNGHMGLEETLSVSVAPRMCQCNLLPSARMLADILHARASSSAKKRRRPLTTPLIYARTKYASSRRKLAMKIARKTTSLGRKRFFLSLHPFPPLRLYFNRFAS